VNTSFLENYADYYETVKGELEELSFSLERYPGHSILKYICIL